MPGRKAHSQRKRRGRRVRRFLQPCLLLLLSSGEAHGYALLPELERFGFNLERLDPSVVYRMLREMETRGWVHSHWSEDSQGPRRRVYAVTAQGKEYLAAWMDDLRATRDEIDKLLESFAVLSPSKRSQEEV
jgi:DNA-binding PadR family transcriptional regulator